MFDMDKGNSIVIGGDNIISDEHENKMSLMGWKWKNFSPQDL